MAELAPATAEALHEGISLFDRQLWWEAHEEWEQAWHEEDGVERLALQALIQLAAAYHKGVHMKNPQGMAKLFERSLEKLETVAGSNAAWGGLDVAALIQIARAGLEQARRWGSGVQPRFEGAEHVRIPRLSTTHP
jgi:predicted metal-dependent hydrolase